MENKIDSGESGRRRFIRRLTTLGAAGGIATLLYGRVTEKPLVQLAQAASGDYMFRDYVNTGIGTTELDSSLATSSSGASTFKVVTSATSGHLRGIYAESATDNGIGICGVASVATSNSGLSPTGVYGEAKAGGGPWPDGPLPNGVWGYASGTSGATTGVYGTAESPDGAGMWGENYADGGGSVGVGGVSHSPEGKGVYGLAYAISGVVAGMRPTGVYGQAGANGGTFPTGPFPAGVEGYASGASGLTTGVYGHVVSPDGTGIGGVSEATSGWGAGVAGFSYSLNGYGVWGEATATSSGPGMAPTGVYGQTDSNGGPAEIGPWPHGVEGYASGTNGTTAGVFGRAESPDGAGVVGLGLANTGYANGVVGQSNSPDGAGVWGNATTTSGQACGVGGQSNSWGAGVYGTGGVGIVGRASDWPGAIAVVAQAASAQTASLQEWWRADYTPLAVVDKDGQFGIGIASPVRQLHIRGNNAVARLDRNVDSASFIFVRTNTDYSQVWKTFTFGVKATGVDSGSFFIGDMHTNVSGSSDNRILIDTSGNVGIGTTTPSSKLHVNGRVKALGYDTGDIKFANSFTVTEDEIAGLAFKNDSDEKIAVLDREGNFHIKGKVMEDL